MERITVPRPAAEALLPRPCDNRYCDGGIIRREDGRGVGYCQVCHGSGVMPPVLRLLVVEGERPAPFGEYPAYRRFDPNVPRFGPDDCSHFEDCEMRDGAETCKYAGCSYDFERRVPPADLARAIESGERIGLDVECDDGRVPVGSVRPVRVMPIYESSSEPHPHWVDRCVVVFPDGILFEPGIDAPESATNATDALSVYGPAESLVGKFAVEVEDARREPP